MSIKTRFFQAANIFVAIFLLTSFFIAGQSICQTIKVADMSALANLSPEPINYFWELNINRAPLDRNQIRYFTDYYEHLLEVFPGFGETYGVLGYCYHYLGNDAKAINYLKIAIVKDPLYAWNYYNLASIYMNESRYQEALVLFLKLQSLDPKDTLKVMFNSQWVYLPLVNAGGKNALPATAEHIKQFYRGSVIVTQLLNQAQRSQEAAGILKSMKMDLYAF